MNQLNCQYTKWYWWKEFINTIFIQITKIVRHCLTNQVLNSSDTVCGIQIQFKLVSLSYFNENDTLVKLKLSKDNSQIFASRYTTILPSLDEFKKIIEE